MSGLDVAQTAPQLWNQLIEAGVRSPDIEQVHRAYRLAARLHSARYRECGKPFVDHLVGTASVVARARLEPELLEAALLHAAYTHGAFDDFARSTSRRRTRALTRVVGPEAEALVHRYATEAWNLPRVTDLADRPPIDTLADWVLLRVANEVDEHLDGAMRLDPKRDEPLHASEGVAAQAKLARRYGFAPVASMLEIAAASAPARSLPKSLVYEPGPIPVVLPLWARPTLKRRLRTRVGRARRRSAR